MGPFSQIHCSQVYIRTLSPRFQLVWGYKLKLLLHRTHLVAVMAVAKKAGTILLCFFNIIFDFVFTITIIVFLNVCMYMFNVLGTN